MVYTPEVKLESIMLRKNSMVLKKFNNYFISRENKKYIHGGIGIEMVNIVSFHNPSENNILMV